MYVDIMCDCEKSKNRRLFLFPAKVSFLNSWTISLDRARTVLSTDGGVEEKLKGNPSKEMAEFPLEDHVFIYKRTLSLYTTAHLFVLVEFALKTH